MKLNRSRKGKLSTATPLFYIYCCSVVLAMEWISVKCKLPEELQTVWACNNETKFVALACLTYHDCWLWAVSNGSIYSEDGKIISECEFDDDYDFTHWMPLPELPSA